MAGHAEPRAQASTAASCTDPPAWTTVLDAERGGDVHVVREGEERVEARHSQVVHRTARASSTPADGQTRRAWSLLLRRIGIKTTFQVLDPSVDLLLSFQASDKGSAKASRIAEPAATFLPATSRNRPRLLTRTDPDSLPTSRKTDGVD